MARTTITVRAPHSVVLVGDPRGEPPSSLSGQTASATETCVAVGTLSEFDGETHISLTDDPISVANRPPILVFQGVISIHGAELAVCSVTGDVYLKQRVHPGTTRVQVWVDDFSEPREIAIEALA